MISHTPPKWAWSTLEKIAASVPNAIVDGPFGSNLKLDDYIESAGGVPVLQGKNVTGDSFTWSDIRFVSKEKAAELKRSSVRVGDILLVKIGSIGYSALIDNLHGFDHAIIPANLAKVTPNSLRIDTGFLHHWLKSTEAKRYLKESASKTAQPALSLSKFKKMPVPLPPLQEQRRIAAILDQAEALRAKRRQALAKLDTLTQSLFLEMFGDPFVANSVCTSGRLIDVVTAVRDCPHSTPDWTETGFRCLRTPDVGRGYWMSGEERFVDETTYLKRSSRALLQAGDIVLSREGTVGIAAIVPPTMHACMGQRLVQIRPDSKKALPEYLLWYLLQILAPARISKVMVGSTAQHLNVRT